MKNRIYIVNKLNAKTFDFIRTIIAFKKRKNALKFTQDLIDLIDNNNNTIYTIEEIEII